MDTDTVFRLLTLKDVEPLGLLLAVIAVLAIALHRGWVYTGKFVAELRASHDRQQSACTTALTAAQSELKASEPTVTDLRIMLTRLTVLEEYGWPDCPSHRTREGAD